MYENVCRCTVRWRKSTATKAKHKRKKGPKADLWRCLFSFFLSFFLLLHDLLFQPMPPQSRGFPATLLHLEHFTRRAGKRGGNQAQAVLHSRSSPLRIVQVCAAAQAASIASIAATAVALRTIVTKYGGETKEETKKEGVERRAGKMPSGVRLSFRASCALPPHGAKRRRVSGRGRARRALDGKQDRIGARA